MIGQLVAAQFDLESAVADLMLDGAPTSAVLEGRNQIGGLLALRHQVAGADMKTLSAMRSDIAAMVASSQSAAQQARAAADTANASTLSNIAQNARAAVNDVMHGMKDFDPYLKFTSPAEEAEYRNREAERRAYIERQQATGTPQGDLNASGAAVGHMADAAAHGAAASPAFEQRWNALIDSTAKLRAQLVQEGRDVSEFDTHLREDLRHILKSKGLSDAQINAQFAAHHDDPMESAQAFVAEQKGVISDREISDLSRKASDYKQGAEEKPIVEQSAAPASPMVDAMAKLKAAGVEMASNVSDQPAHGVTAQAAINPSLSRSL